MSQGWVAPPQWMWDLSLDNEIRELQDEVLWEEEME